MEVLRNVFSGEIPESGYLGEYLDKNWDSQYFVTKSPEGTGTLRITVPDDASIEESIQIIARIRMDPTDNAIITVREGDHYLSCPAVIARKVNIQGEGRVRIYGAWLLGGIGGDIAGVELCHQSGACVKVECGNWRLDRCTIVSPIADDLDPLAFAEDGIGLWCCGGNTTLRECSVGGYADESGLGKAKDGIVACGSGRISAEFTKITWCDHAIGCSDNATVSLRTCEISYNRHALVGGIRNKAALSVHETRLFRNDSLWFGSFRPSKITQERNGDDKGRTVDIH